MRKNLLESITNEMRNEDAAPPNSKELFLESTMKRVESWIRSKECAIVTAWRTFYANTTPNTFKPTHSENGRFMEAVKAYRRKIAKGYEPTAEETQRYERMISSGECYEAGEPFKQGDKFTTDEKRHYNRELNAALLQLKYGVTEIRGVFREEGCTGCDSDSEDSFLVVNLSDDPNFKDNLFRLSEYYNQDCFMYSPYGTDKGVLVGTNSSSQPGYKAEVEAGSFNKHVESMYMSRIGNAGFAFGDAEKMKPDSRPAFLDRKAARINAVRQLESVLPSIDDYMDRLDWHNIGGKRCIRECCERVLNQIGLL